MTVLFSYLTLVLIFGLTLFFALNKKLNKKTNLIFKIISLVLAAIFFFRYMLGNDAVENMFKLTSNIFSNKFTNLVAILLVWLTYSSNLVLILYGFFNVRLRNKFVYFLTLPLSILNLIILPIHLKAILGVDALTNFSARALLIAAEVGVSLAYSLAVIIKTVNFKQLFAKKDKADKQNYKLTFKHFFLSIWLFIKKHWVGFFCWGVVLLSTMPAYALQAIFGEFYHLLSVADFEMPHRILLYIGIITPFVIHLSLRDQSYEEKKFYLLFICLATLISYLVSHRFADFADPTDWPLHLCNTAMFIMPVVLIFNMKKFFYFTYFINIAGAAIAMLLPNYNVDSNILSTGIIRFYINHYIAFFMPILFVSLGMFVKPKLKHFIYSMLGFLGYFLLVLFLNALFTGLAEIGKVSGATDFFFLNDDFIAGKLGVLEVLKNQASFTIAGVTLKFYPLYQTLFFFAYVGIGLAMWFIFAQSYEIAETFTDMRRKKEKIKLDKLALKIEGENMKNPVNPENKDKLVLINFSKKYGSSKHFAVKDANLEVNSGEIFGFLGPNGAGKSTIIKSIVGIQPITSGRIEVCGYDMGTQPIECKMNLGFVPDHYALYEKLTGREYINYIADLYGVSKADRDERIENMVNRFELAHSFDNQIKTYSHGMKQKIAIMAALVHNPKIWILDEPLTGLDPNSIFQVKECMKEHVRKGNIVFFSSHIIDVVEKICDKIAIIKKGEIQCVKTLEEIEKSGTSLEKFYMDIINK